MKARVLRSVVFLGQVASKLRTQLSDAREAVHGKILATDRLGLELQKEREELRRLRESSALQEAHHKRLQVRLTPSWTLGTGSRVSNLAECCDGFILGLGEGMESRDMRYLLAPLGLWRTSWAGC